MFFLAFAALAMSGCSLFIGNVRPVEEKSETYRILDLSKVNPDWKRLESQTDPSRTDISDLTFQSERTAAIISLNSACRPTWENPPPDQTSEQAPQQDLKAFMRQLLLGFSDRNIKEEREFQVDGQPALLTTLDGKLQGNQVRLSAIVVHKGPCVYDLMFVSRPETYQQQQADFSKFVASIKLR